MVLRDKFNLAGSSTQQDLPWDGVKLTLVEDSTKPCSPYGYNVLNVLSGPVTPRLLDSNKTA